MPDEKECGVGSHSRVEVGRWFASIVPFAICG